MKYITYVSGFVLFIVLNGYSQSNQNINKLAKEYYHNLQYRYGVQSAEYINEHGFAKGPFTRNNPNPFAVQFYKNERDSLSTVFLNKTECMPTAIAYMEERLSIWELMEGGGLPDSTFTVLMDTYYSIAPNEAMASCIRRSNYNKIHDINIRQYINYNILENYPYVDFLFENLSAAELLDVLIMCHDTPLAQNKKLMDICCKRIRYDQKDSSEVRFEMIKQYVKSKLELENTLSYNEYFVALILGKEDHSN